MDTDPNFDLAALAFGKSYCSGLLPTTVSERIAGAVAAFTGFTETRPVVVVIDVMFWWVSMRFMAGSIHSIQSLTSPFSHQRSRQSNSFFFLSFSTLHFLALIFQTFWNIIWFFPHFQT